MPRCRFATRKIGESPRNRPDRPQNAIPQVTEPAARSPSRPLSRRYRSRSCSRFARPCQNSITSGKTRYPPQNSGIGTSVPSGQRRSSSAYRSSSSAREPITEDCLLAHAPSWEPRGREWKYGSLSLGGQRGHRPLDDHLPLDRVPGEQQARPRHLRQVAALAGCPVGVEREPAGVVALEQHRPGPRPAVARDRGQHHRGRLGQRHGHHVGHPAVELVQRVIGDHRLGQARVVRELCHVGRGGLTRPVNWPGRSTAAPPSTSGRARNAAGISRFRRERMSPRVVILTQRTTRAATAAPDARHHRAGWPRPARPARPGLPDVHRARLNMSG